MNLAEVRYPQLPAPYDKGLRACVEDLFDSYDVVSVLVSGTIVLGIPDKNSDLDINLLHTGDFRERVQAFYEGVACEVFVNPPSRIRGYFEESRQTRRPPMAHMFATGFVMFDPEGVAAGLVADAKLELALPPPIKEEDVVRAKYAAATTFEDAEDLITRDPEAALLFLSQAVFLLAQCRVAMEPGWLPRPKDLLVRLREIDPLAAELVARADQGGLEQRFEAGRRLCRHVTGATGFFEWTSVRETI